MVFFHMLILGTSFLFATRLFGMKPALVGFLLIAFDPFHIALSKILHLDGMLADLMLLSLLAFLDYLNTQKSSSIVVSGVAAGMAWLTKSPGLFLILFIALLAVFISTRSRDSKNQKWNWNSIRLIAKPLILWGSIGALTVFLFWPAMWVNPLANLEQVVTDAINYAQTGHNSAIFFNGKIYADGGVPNLGFYPVSFLWRTTPTTLLGLITTIYLLFRQRYSLHTKSKPLLQDRQAISLIVLLFFALGFAALMTLGLKKFDRYIIPSLVSLDLVAGVSLAWMIEWVICRLQIYWKTGLTILLSFSVVAGQAALSLAVSPYYLSYHNPLFGGNQRAVEVMQIGWGEGLDQAAKYINSKSNSEQLKVIAWYGTGPFSYFSNSIVSSLDVDHPWSQADWDEFNKSDYAVVYIHQWQRNLPEEVLDHLKNLKPEYSVWIGGLEYAQVYKIH